MNIAIRSLSSQNDCSLSRPTFLVADRINDKDSYSVRANALKNIIDGFSGTNDGAIVFPPTVIESTFGTLNIGIASGVSADSIRKRAHPNGHCQLCRIILDDRGYKIHRRLTFAGTQEKQDCHHGQSPIFDLHHGTS
ncbi:hypothetical protein HN859_03330 [Candidatus Parcubacteria bacterium]|nr:hypothetical protein [Candidatus Parcubacteria bacterium]